MLCYVSKYHSQKHGYRVALDVFIDHYDCAILRFTSLTKQSIVMDTMVSVRRGIIFLIHKHSNFAYERAHQDENFLHRQRLLLLAELTSLWGFMLALLIPMFLKRKSFHYVQ